MTKPVIGDIVDLDRYPIDDIDSPEVRALLQRGRDNLDAVALFSMPGFVLPTAAQAMAGQLEGLLSRSCRYDQPRIAYDYDGSDWPSDHPRSVRHPCSYNQVLNYQIPNDSSLRMLYHWQPLTDFLGEMLGYETFYRSDCPHLALTSKIAGEGDSDGWHFDSNDVVFSVLLQAPESGGQFEYAPYLRSEQDQNYPGVSAVFDDPRSNAVRAGISPGDLTVFKGDLSLHRVTPVEGERPRIVALFCYDRKPGTTFSQTYIDELQGYLPEIRADN